MRKRDYLPRQGIAVILLLLFAAFVASVAMVDASVPTTFDGNRCPGAKPDPLPNSSVWDDYEWGEPDFYDGDDGYPDSAEILNIWAGLVDADLYLAFNRKGGGTSSFSWYFNTDCNNKSNDVAHGGAEWAAFFSMKPGGVTSNTLWKWDNGTGKYVDIGTGFGALVGSYTCTNGTPDIGTKDQFFEMKIYVPDIFDPCNGSDPACGDIDFVGGSSNAGNSPNSEDKDDATGKIPLDANLPPTAEAGPNQTVCLGSAVILNGSGSTDPDNDIVLYEWDIDYDGITFDIDYTGVTASHTYTTTGTYTVALRVTDSWGCNVTDNLTVTVLQAPTANISITHTDPCNLTITYDGTGSIDPTLPFNLTYSWDFGDGVGNSSAASGTYTYALPGTYTISLMVTDPDSSPPCNTDIATTPLTVKDCTDPVIVNVTQSNDEPCAGENVTITAHVTDDVNVTSVNLTYDGTTIPMTMVSGTAKDGNWTAIIPGQTACTWLSIFVTARDLEGNEVSSASHDKHWKDCTPPVIVNVTQSNDEPCAGENVTITAHVTDDVNVTSVNLTYDGTTIPMTMVSGTAKDGNWTAIIPGQTACTWLSIFVTARDLEGNEVSSASHDKHWKDCTPPVIVNVTQSNDEPCAGENVTITAHVTDDVNVTSVNLTYDGTTIPMTMVSGTAKDGNWTAIIPGQTACTWLSIFVTARDLEGNEVSSASHDKHWKDCTPPVIVNVTQSNDEPCAGENVTITAHVTDDVNVTSVNLTYDGTTVPMTMVSGNGTDGNWTAIIPGQTACTWLSIFVTARDLEGNEVSSASHEKHWKDCTPPVIVNVTQSNDEPCAGENVTITAHVTDDVNVTSVNLTYDGTTVPMTMVSGNGTDGNWTAIIPGQTACTWLSIFVTARDLEGNEVSSASHDKHWKDCTPPVIVNVTQSNDEPCAGENVTITAHVTDDVNVTSVNLTYDGTTVPMTMVSGNGTDGNWTAIIPGQTACTWLSIFVTARDLEGNEVSSASHDKHWKDCTPPVIVNVTQSNDEPCAGDDVTITAHVTDDVNVTTVNLTYDGTTVPMTMVSGNGTDGNWTAIIPGQTACTWLSIFVTARDLEGNEVSSAPHEKHWKDCTPPVIVNVTQSNDEPCAGEDVTITAHVTDDVNVTTVNLTYDGTTVPMTMVSGNGTDGNWTAIIPGQTACTWLSIFVTARDLEGNEVSSAPHEKHWKDCTPPVIVNVTQSNDEPCAGEDVTITAHVTDDVNVTTVNLTYDGTTVPMTMVSGNGTDGNWTAIIPGQTACTWLSIFVTARDLEGNEVSSAPHDKHWKDCTPPVIVNVTQSNDEPCAGENVTITAHVTDDVNVTSVNLTYDGTTVPMTMVSGNGTDGNWTAIIPGQTACTWLSIFVTARDLEGNEVSSAPHEKHWKDCTPPVIVNVTQSNDEPCAGEDVTITAHVTDDVNVTTVNLTYDGTTVPMTMVSGNGTDGNWTAIIPGQTACTWLSIFVTARDLEGNEVSSAPHEKHWKDCTPPVIVNVTQSNDEPCAGENVTITAHVTDDVNVTSVNLTYDGTTVPMTMVSGNGTDGNWTAIIPGQTACTWLSIFVTARDLEGNEVSSAPHEKHWKDCTPPVIVNVTQSNDEPCAGEDVTITAHVTDDVNVTSVNLTYDGTTIPMTMVSGNGTDGNWTAIIPGQTACTWLSIFVTARDLEGNEVSSAPHDKHWKDCTDPVIVNVTQSNDEPCAGENVTITAHVTDDVNVTSVNLTYDGTTIPMTMVSGNGTDGNWTAIIPGQTACTWLSIFVTARDLEGNEVSSAPHEKHWKDCTDPVIVNVTQSNDEPCAGENVTITAHVTDDVNVTSVNLTYDGTTVPMTMVSGNGTDGNWTAIIPGQTACTWLSIFVTARDLEGNEVSSAPHEKHWKDCTDPVIVNVTQSNDEPCAGENVTITAHVTDDVNVTSVNLTYDGTTVPMTMVSGNGTDGNWTAIIPGQTACTWLSIFVTARDLEGNEVSSAPHEKHWKDCTPPVIVNVTQSNDEPCAGENVTITAHVTDDVNVTTVNLTYDGTTVPMTMVSGNGTDGNWTAIIPGQTACTWLSIFVTARDLEGNEVSSAPHEKHWKDCTPPVIVNVTQSNDEPCAGENVTITAHVTDDVNVTTVNLTYDGTTVPMTMVSGNGTDGNWTAIIPGQTACTWLSIFVTARDLEGNEVSSAPHEKHWKDCTPPVIVNVTQSNDEPCAGENVTITAHVTDDVNVTTVNLTYDGTTVPMTMVSGNGTDGNWTAIIPGQTACTWLSIFVTARDLEGNEVSSAPHEKHWKDCTPPVIVNVTQSNDEPCAGENVTITAHVTDDVNVTSVNLTYDGTTIPMTMVSGNGTDGNWTAIIPGQTACTWLSIFVTARDLEGNEVSSAPHEKHWKDCTDPVIVNVTQSNDEPCAGENVTITAHVTDDVNVTTVNLTYDGTTVPMTMVSGNGTDGNWTAIIPGQTACTTLTIYVTATDGENTVSSTPHEKHWGLVAIDVEKTADPTEGAPSTDVTFTITVKNTGDITLNLVKVVDTLPGGMSYVSSTPAADTHDGIITWDNVGQLNPGASTTITLVAHIDSGASGTLTDTVNVTGTPPEGDNVTDSDTAYVTTLEPAITVTKTASPSSGAPSTNVNFTIVVTNTGDSTLNPVKVVDTLPTGMSYVSSSPTANTTGGTTIWDNVGLLTSSGGSKTLYLVAHIDYGATGTLINTVNATGTPPAGDNVTDSDTATVVVRPKPKPPIPPITRPQQAQYFKEKSSVQGVGEIYYEKTILASGVGVREYMWGDTGNGTFAMTIHEVLDEGVRLNCSGNCSDMGKITDPIYGDDESPVMTNFECKKMVQFEIGAKDNPLIYGLEGEAIYSNPGFSGGMNAQVKEYYAVSSLQKDETVRMTTTATFDGTTRDWTGCNPAKPYNANELNFDTKNAFTGSWGTDSSWKKVCSKDIKHHQYFDGTFQVDKNLMFQEEVTKPWPEKEPHGDC